MPPTQLAAAIQQLAQTLPAEVLRHLGAVLTQHADADWTWRRTHLVQHVTQSGSRAAVVQLVDAWQAHAPTMAPKAVALALETAAAIQVQAQNEQVELVWTGPNSRAIPLRRTDQVLLDLITHAAHSLHLVSFATYKLPTLNNALLNAATRGIALHIYLETPEASYGKIGYNTLHAFGEELHQHAHFYIWPRSQRPTAEGKHGSLHAKLALADTQTLFISSANLTGYAMTLNMEMGVLLHGGPHPRRVAEHLQRLREQGVFQLVNNKHSPE